MTDDQHTDDPTGREGADQSQLADSADAEQRKLIEPDRGAEGKVSPREQDARERVHTDRDPADDIHLAAQRGQSGQS